MESFTLVAVRRRTEISKSLLTSCFLSWVPRVQMFILLFHLHIHVLHTFTYKLHNQKLKRVHDTER